MAAAPKRIACLALLSAIAPIVYLVGWARGIEGIRAWPSWLFYVWPFELLFLPFAGEKEFGVDYVVMGAIAVSLNVLYRGFGPMASVGCCHKTPGTAARRRMSLFRSLGPNRSVNADAPGAALRARGGSPVTFVR